MAKRKAKGAPAAERAPKQRPPQPAQLPLQVPLGPPGGVYPDGGPIPYPIDVEGVTLMCPGWDVWQFEQCRKFTCVHHTNLGRAVMYHIKHHPESLKMLVTPPSVLEDLAERNKIMQEELDELWEENGWLHAQLAARPTPPTRQPMWPAGKDNDVVAGVEDDEDSDGSDEDGEGSEGSNEDDESGRGSDEDEGGAEAAESEHEEEIEDEGVEDNMVAEETESANEENGGNDGVADDSALQAASAAFVNQEQSADEGEEGVEIKQESRGASSADEEESEDGSEHGETQHAGSRTKTVPAMELSMVTNSRPTRERVKELDQTPVASHRSASRDLDYQQLIEQQLRHASVESLALEDGIAFEAARRAASARRTPVKPVDNVAYDSDEHGPNSPSHFVASVEDGDGWKDEGEDKFERGAEYTTFAAFNTGL